MFSSFILGWSLLWLLRHLRDSLASRCEPHWPSLLAQAAGKLGKALAEALAQVFQNLGSPGCTCLMFLKTTGYCMPFWKCHEKPELSWMLLVWGKGRHKCFLNWLTCLFLGKKFHRLPESAQAKMFTHCVARWLMLVLGPWLHTYRHTRTRMILKSFRNPCPWPGSEAMLDKCWEDK